MSDELIIYLNNQTVGKLRLLSGERSFFAFDEGFLESSDRPVLSQSFLSQQGGLITETKIRQTKLPPFFSNLLPEGHLRTYLASKSGIKPEREFKLMALLGEDLPGAVRVKLSTSANEQYPRGVEDKKDRSDSLFHFSLAGVQLKFSALAESAGGLTIPVNGVGGDWIVKLPAHNFSQVPENEWSMLHLAKQIGIPVPETQLIDIDDIKGLPDLGVFSGNKAFVIKRFDREENQRIHIEDFAQVYGVYPNDKYGKVNYSNMANMLWILMGEEGVVDFIRRLTFTVLIGNGDMHLKNWSLIYPDGKTAKLAPAYDYISTIPYIPDDTLALNLSGSKDMQAISLKHFKKLALKAEIPAFIVLQTVKETVAAVREAWSQNKQDYPMADEILKRIDRQIMEAKLEA